ncbi:MAG: CocE/NonD family hydrolase [Actinomycetota bacterium]
MRRRTLGTLLATMVVGAMLVVTPGTALADPYTPVTESVSIKTEFGQLYVEITRPEDDGKMVKGPSVVTLSPYSALGRENVATPWVPEGYVSVFADVIGTGNSGGCYDYGGERERRTGYELVEWIAKQPWSNGKVAMIGGSYNGTTAWATATERPPHLTTIVPEAAIARWYSYAYSGGVRYNLNNEFPADEGVDTPLLFDFGFALPPPLDVEDPAWADKVGSTIAPCDELTHMEHGYDETPDYDDFWIERDYLRDAKKIDIPVLIAHNWGDWNVKQENATMMYKALAKSNSEKTSLYMGTRWSGHGTPGGDYDKVVRAWFDHYLMGENNGIDKLPAVTSQMADYDGSLKKWYSGSWPKTRDYKLIAQQSPPTSTTDYQWKLLTTKYRPGLFPEEPAAFPMDAPNAESHANHHGRLNHEWWWWESPPLKKDTRIFGEIKIKLWSRVDRTWTTLTPVIVDYKHECHTFIANQHAPTAECTTQPAPSSPVTPRPVVSVTRGFLDTRYRNGLAEQVPLEPGKEFGATVVTKPQDYVFRKGHSIALSIMTTNTEWALPKVPDPTGSQDCLAGAGDAAQAQACEKLNIIWNTNKTQLILPIVKGPRNPMDLFNFKHKHGEDCTVDDLPVCP